MIRGMAVAALLGGLGALAGFSVDEATVPAVTSAAGPVSQAEDPLTRPMAVERARTWLAPLPPEKLYGQTYLVGFAGLSVALIDTGAGLVLVDGGLPQAAPAILENVRALGFDPKDIKFILSTEPHFDHAGGLAALVRDTGATVVASARGAEGLRTGAHAQDDPQLGYGGTWPAVTDIRVVEDGEVLALGNTRITAQATPGHTMGSMSWSWSACEADVCKAVVFASSLNPVSFPDYRYTAPSSAGILRGFSQSYRRLDGLACDILIAAHPDFAGEGRFDARPGACRAYVDRSRRSLATRLATERSGASD
ncbi:subclass B3 metallo-beta-lactamase [Brevundimonas sp. R86498]|uniref:subclass B3 metallo-beta-lactamase n=1 Tax=Brevundimonas sp. R86498 TaxID=3093845 RepID=UPI0037C9AC27